MADPGEDALLDRPRIRAVSQHFEVVVGLQHDEVAAAELGLHIGRHVAKIGGDGQANSLGGEDEADRVGCVMGDGEWADAEVADRERLAGAEVLDGRELCRVGGDGRSGLRRPWLTNGIRSWIWHGIRNRIVLGSWIRSGIWFRNRVRAGLLLLSAVLLGPFGVRNPPVRGDLTNPCAMRGFGEVDGDSEFAGGDGETVDVVLVLVRDEDCVEGAGIFADVTHAAEEFAAAQSGVDEDSRSGLPSVRTAGNDTAVSFGAGGEDGEANHLSRIVPMVGEMWDGIGGDSSFGNGGRLSVSGASLHGWR